MKTITVLTESYGNGTMESFLYHDFETAKSYARNKSEKCYFPRGLTDIRMSEISIFEVPDDYQMPKHKDNFDNSFMELEPIKQVFYYPEPTLQEDDN
jgi:hypothetical protein